MLVVFGLFHEGHDLLAFHGGKPCQKIVNGVARLQTIEQCLAGHTGAGEAGRSAHYFRVDTDDLPLLHAPIVRGTALENNAGHMVVLVRFWF